MMRTVEATMNASGQVKLKEDISLKGTTRVLVTFLDESWESNESAILAEPSLAPGWVGADADEDWKHLGELPDLDEVAR